MRTSSRDFPGAGGWGEEQAAEILETLQAAAVENLEQRRTLQMEEGLCLHAPSLARLTTVRGPSSKPYKP